jgi:diguanylate cyclase (GGDEF)-like protein/PAS domain S-box-containing protein
MDVPDATPPLGEDRAQTLADQSSELLMIADGDQIVRWANSTAERVLGNPFAPLVGTDIFALFQAEDVPALVETIARLRKTPGTTGGVSYRLRSADGAWHWMETTTTNLLDEPAIGGFVISMRDATERQHDDTALERSEERYRDLVEHARDWVFTADLAGNFTSVNTAAEQITGFSSAELCGMSFFDVVVPQERERLEWILARRVTGGPQEDAELQLIHKDGRRLFISVAGRVVEEGGRRVRIEGIVRDTTERHVLEERLRYQAFHDALTGLPNRALLHDRVDLALARAEREKSHVTVMLLDVDDFKVINDSLGHAVGDEVLVELAGRLRSILRSNETVARMGGDEFVIVTESIRAQSEVCAVAKRVLSVFAEPFTIAGRKRTATGSLGIALSRDGAGASNLLRDADTAMYRAKANRKGGFEVFDPGLRVELLRQIALTEGLGEALRDDKLEVYYQPIVSLVDGQILAIEALARWHHPEWGEIQPDEFIPLAEGSGIIIPLGKYVLREAAREAAQWRKNLPGALPLGVFVNVSPHELSERDFVSFITDTLAEHGLAASDLAIELTERVIVDEHDEMAAQTLSELARLGIRLVIDDFGTGYSALSSLRRFPLAAVKIDRYFIEEIDTHDAPGPIIRALVGLADALRVTVIAEGVENSIQHGYLRGIGCNVAQGFWLGRPQAATTMSTLILATPELAEAPMQTAVLDPHTMPADSTGLGAPIPPDDEERLAALRRYNVLDTEPEPAFDEIARLAAHICETPMALVSLVDRDREYFKAVVGTNVRQSSRNRSFCGHAIVTRGLFVVPDTLADPRFAPNPDVAGGAHVRFYAGIPLVTPDGYAIGVLCVKDTQPRELTETQRDALMVLGRQAAAQLELSRLLAVRRGEAIGVGPSGDQPR